MKEKDLIIGIDPDLERSGVAAWNASGKSLDLRTLSFFQLYDFLQAHADRILLVRVEAGWLNRKSNFHSRAGQTKPAGESIARNVGENHAAGKLICQMCVYLELHCEEVQPQAHKLNRDSFRAVTGYRERTNQETRDAAMLVYGINSKII
jgi:hypothetical protein